MLGKLKILGELLIVTFSAYYLAVGAYLLVIPVKIFSPDPTVVATAGDSYKKVDRSQFNIINNRNIFGAFDPKKVKKPKKKKRAQSDLNKLPMANSNLRLLGTVYSSNKSLMRAIMVVGRGVRVFKEGQGVGKTKILEIKRRAVVLWDGKKKSLLMIDKGDKSIAAKSDSGNVLINKDVLKDVFANPRAFLDNVDFTLAKKDGRKGLLINSLERKSLLASAGIRQGDLIVSVNGHNLNSLTDVMGMAKLRIENSVVIKVWRNQRFETLRLKFSNA
ncbi:PDZ domain-containing protein [Maridesulfovibrio bastinii]|uniref:PDZ domain-containing protein n=1 Tax=Maridesulfovibrio bastinii TaxID=47157 RepID=UPI00041A2B38|nr:PDZ domain-containing protein [Maridesulfovibrio bastinii]